ncbi:MAG: replicative DNA helicase, partial [Planctomycetes bacterium]|nr:replicative DNA helicase [Planctomycetota bacterium]
MGGVTERVLPQCMEAESSVLGAVLRDNATIAVASRLLKPGSFYSAGHQIIFETVLSIYEKRGAVDLVLLGDELERRGLLGKCGGAAYLASLEDNGTPAHVELYATTVRDRAFMRQLVGVCSEVTDTLCETGRPPSDLRDWAEGKLFEAFQNWQTGDVAKLDELVRETMKRIDDLHEGKGAMLGLQTRFPRLDDLICGLQPSQLLIIAGRPSMGKSSFALNIVENVGIQQQIPVLLFSLETSRDQIANNLLCSRARVDAHRVRKGMLTDALRMKLVDAAGFVYKAPVFIDDSTNLSILDCKARARHFKAKENIGLVVIDYLQLMEAPGHRGGDSREQEIAYISRSLKGLARELNIPVIALSQLNRAVEGREDKRPRLSDLRESG